MLVKRVSLSALAVLPAVGLAFVLPQVLGLLDDPQMRVVFLSATVVAALAAIALSLRPGSDDSDDGVSLFRPGTLRRARRDLPDSDAQRDHLLDALYPHGGADLPVSVRPAPDSFATARACALFQVMDRFGLAGLEQAGPAQLAELYLLDQVITADPGEAARIAQFFHNPSAVLDLRDQIAGTEAEAELVRA